jgi:hypothetical protein
MVALIPSNGIPLSLEKKHAVYKVFLNFYKKQGSLSGEKQIEIQWRNKLQAPSFFRGSLTVTRDL